MANPAPATEPTEQVNEDVLCDIENAILFQAVLTRLASMLKWYEWDKIADKLASLSPRSLIVAIATGEFRLSDINAKRLLWMLHGPNPYILKHPTMMHEVRELHLWWMQTYPPSVHHFTSLRKLDWNSDSSSLPDDAFSLLRQHVTGLQDLHVHTERLSVPMLNDIVQMTNLESLRLYATFYDAFPPLGNLQRLKILSIWETGQHNEALILPSTLEGLTRIETLDLYAKISDDLADMMPAMFPLLRELHVGPTGLSKKALATLKSHYKNKEGFELAIWDD